MVTVLWDDAVSYCRSAGKRLPSEAEWEYATRAGTTTRYWWGQGNPGTRRVENIADEAAKNLIRLIMSGYDDGAVRTAPVGSYETNPWGLHDISGNVREWTADWYDGVFTTRVRHATRKDPLIASIGCSAVGPGTMYQTMYGPRPDLARTHETVRHYRVPLRPGRSEITFTLEHFFLFSGSWFCVYRREASDTDRGF